MRLFQIYLLLLCFGFFTACNYKAQKESVKKPNQYITVLGIAPVSYTHLTLPTIQL